MNYAELCERASLKPALHPAYHSAAQIVDIIVSLLLQEHACLCGTGATAANKYQLFIAAEFIEFNRQRMQWHRLCARHRSRCNFTHTAHVYNTQIRVLLLYPGCELRGINFLN